MFLVVLLHSSSKWIYKFGTITMTDWRTANWAESASRVCVPLFLMISGYLLIGRQDSIRGFFRRRFAKVLIPWLAWSVIYSLYVLAYKQIAVNSPVLYALRKFLGGGIYYHLGFLYVIIGLYLCIPFLSWLFERDFEKRALYFVTLCFVAASLLPFTSTLATLALDREIRFAFDLAAFTGHTGYLVVGALLGRHTKWEPPVWVCLTLYLAGTAFTAMATEWLSQKTGRLHENFYEYLAPNIVIMSVAAFVMLKKLGAYVSGVRVLFWLEFCSAASFGIYLLHPIILDAVILHLPAVLDQNPLVSIISTCAIVFSLSWAATQVVSKIPYVRRIV